MSRIPQATLDEIKQKTDLVALVRKHLELRRTGAQYRGLCPFHEERTPSFYVDPKRQSYKCYGCGEWGSAIDFLCKTEGRSFLECVRQLAAMAQVSLPTLSGEARGAPSPDAAQLQRRERAFQINHAAMDFYREILTSAPYAQAARDYQQRRGIDDELAQRFCLGYAPAPSEARWDALTQHLHKLGHDLQLAADLGLVVRNQRNDRYFDRLRGRWVFPILTPGRSVVGFSGRILPEHQETHEPGQPPSPKYVNSPETVVFKKSDMLFGLHAASRGINARHRVILVEGNVDVLALHRAGFAETLAPLGTALTAAQSAKLRRLSDTVVLCFDGDRAGRQAAWKALPLLLEQAFDIRIIALPDGQDPSSLDADALAQGLREPPPAIPWFLRYVIRSGALQSIESRDRALQSVADLLARIPTDTVRQDYAALAATMFRVPVQRVDGLVHGRRRDAPLRRDRTPTTPQREVSAQITPAQAALVALLFDHPTLAKHPRSDEILQYVQDSPLEPIARALLSNAGEGKASPAQGELLAMVEQKWHRTLRDSVFHEDYSSIPDPDAVLDEGLRRAHKDRLEGEIKALDAQTAKARDQGDTATLRALAQQKIELRRAQNQLQDKLRGGAGTV